MKRWDFEKFNGFLKFKRGNSFLKIWKKFWICKFVICTTHPRPIILRHQKFDFLSVFIYQAVVLNHLNCVESLLTPIRIIFGKILKQLEKCRKQHKYWVLNPRTTFNLICIRSNLHNWWLAALRWARVEGNILEGFFGFSGWSIQQGINTANTKWNNMF